ncbi:hypothetical protein [Luteibacter sp. ME-Dv--P-043b]|jgi:hypothetical protein|uniref:hypothetical protein n=1 Tax=unclassified Luteibacter TaxID=2620188 RepID=UPI002554E574|nr:hypothetical protein [Luteibacter sp. ME-Dv--P-043b]
MDVEKNLRAVALALIFTVGLGACSALPTSQTLASDHAALLSHTDPATPYAEREPSGPTVVRHLQARYDSQDIDCGQPVGSSPSRPSFLCTGVLLRATVPGNYFSWDPNPNSKKGSVSFAWLRTDATFRTIYTPRYANGFIILPVFYADDFNYEKLQVLCAFPLDGGTDNRDSLGCGMYGAAAPRSRRCEDQGITTGAQWVSNYRIGNTYTTICSFNVSSGSGDTARRFMQMGAAMRLMNEPLDPITPDRSYTNELLIATWRQGLASTFPIEAFFYQTGVPGGPANARKDQGDFKRQSGRWVPVVSMTMPSNRNDKVKFGYNEADQDPTIPHP